MMKVPFIEEYQVRQTSCGVDVDVVVHAPIDPAVVAAAIEDGLRQAGLTSPTATVGVVEAIPSHPETGKTRRFVPIA